MQFGLQFEAGILEPETAEDDKQVNEPDPSAAQELPASEGSNTNDKDAPVKASNDDTTVVSLDAFRKK